MARIDFVCCFFVCIFVRIQAGTRRWNNVYSALIQRLDVESTLNRHCFNGVCLLGYDIRALFSR